MEEAIDPYKEYGVVTPDEINRDLDAAVRKANNLPSSEEFLESIKRDNPALYARWMAGPQLISFCRAAEEIVTIYGALRTYLKVLSQQPEEDLETIARVTRLMIAIKPQAVEASQEIARTNTNGN